MKSLTNIFNDILFKDKLPEELILSLIVPIFKGKGDPLNPNSYREYCCLNMLLNCRRRIYIKCNMDLCQGEELLILCLFWGDLGKISAKNEKLFFIFVDLEKAFDWVPREVICFGLRRKGGGGCPRTFGNLYVFMMVVKLLSQLMENCQGHFLWKLASIKGLLFVHTYLLIYHGNGCSDTSHLKQLQN